MQGSTTTTTTTRLGTFRAYYLGSVVCIGGFLFGYDSGIVGGVLTLASFERDYRYTAADATRVAALAVGLQQLGALVACFLAWPLTERWGRRPALMLASAVFCVGAAVQTANTHSLAAFYVARVVAGLGLGTATVVVPLFSAEMSPKEVRGQIGSFFQWFFTLGIFVSYWVDYGVALGAGTSSRQWQIPIGLQLVPGALLGLGMLTLKESTRWLTKKGRHAEALESLAWIRGVDGHLHEEEQEEEEEGNASQQQQQLVREEMADIRLGVEREARATEGFRLRELLQRDNAPRVLAAFALFLAQQATGATAFAYFGPQYFALLVGPGTQTNLLLTAIFGAVKVVACGLFVLFVSERVGRRNVLVLGAVFMSACQLTTAVLDKVMPPPPGDGPISSAGSAMVALIYLFVVAYNFSWGPMPWPYVSE